MKTSVSFIAVGYRKYREVYVKTSVSCTAVSYRK